MGKLYNNKITTTAGFKYPAEQPLDDREVVESYEDLATLVDSHASYEGMRVYVVADKKSYELIEGTWKAIATEDFIEAAIVEAKLPADWNQHDETAADYIKNRTHYEKGKLITVAESIEASYLAEDMAFYPDVDELDFSFVTNNDEGKVFRIYSPAIHGYKSGTLKIFDGYVGTGYIYGYIGNSSLAGEAAFDGNAVTDTGEDFCLAIEDWGGGCCVGFYFADGSNFVDTQQTTFKIIRESDDFELKQLDEKYIPDTIARISNIEKDWNQSDKTAKDYIKNKTHYAYENFVEVLDDATNYVQEWEFEDENNIVHYIVEAANDTYGNPPFVSPKNDGKTFRIYCPSLYKGYKEGVLHVIEEDINSYCDTVHYIGYIGNEALVGSGDDTGEDFYLSATSPCDDCGEGGYFLNTTDYSRWDGHTQDVVIKVECDEAIIKQLDEKYIPDSCKVAVRGIGEKSTILGLGQKAIGVGSISAGQLTQAMADFSVAEGKKSKTYAPYSHAQGLETQTGRITMGYEVEITHIYSDEEVSGYDFYEIGYYDPLEDDYIILTEDTKFTLYDSNKKALETPDYYILKTDAVDGEYYEGEVTVVCEGFVDVDSSAKYIAIGEGNLGTLVINTAGVEGSSVRGKYNKIDTQDKYLEIVGNGSSNTNRSNAYTLDSAGNATFAGSISGASIKIGNTTFTETQLKKILNFIDTIEG